MACHESECTPAFSGPCASIHPAIHLSFFELAFLCVVLSVAVTLGQPGPSTFRPAFPMFSLHLLPSIPLLTGTFFFFG